LPEILTGKKSEDLEINDDFSAEAAIPGFEKFHHDESMTRGESHHHRRVVLFFVLLLLFVDQR
jgi:hypothetical protein